MTAYYHLPGLFEFYDFYKVFLPLWREHPDWFYDWCEIASIYGAPGDCLWGGGRTSFGNADTADVIALMNKYELSARLTFSNSLLREEYLSDKKCNQLCNAFEKTKDLFKIIIMNFQDKIRNTHFLKFLPNPQNY